MRAERRLIRRSSSPTCAADERIPRRITAGDGKVGCVERSIAWSPDGKRIAFLSDRDKEGQFQVYIAPAEGGEVRQLTKVAGLLADPRWSPDGARLGVLFTRDATKAIGPLQPGEAPTGVIDEKVLEQRLSTIDLHSGELREVSPPDMYVYEFDWSPDGTRCVAIAAQGSGDNHWYVAQLYDLAMATGEMRTILDPRMQVAVPRWSPDGRTIAFIGGLMSDEGVTGGDIYLVPATGGRHATSPRRWRAPRAGSPGIPPRDRSSSPSTSTAAAASPGRTWTEG